MSIKEKLERIAQTFRRIGETFSPPNVAPARVGNYIDRRNFRRSVRR